jgi:uncharacterized coiled-coil protein SlyX
MALPRQVQAQLAEVEELEKTLTAQKEPKEKKAEKPEETEVPEDTETEVPVEAEEATKLVEVKSAGTPPTDVADDFKQKYNTLRGKYDAEVPRLHQQLKDLTSKIEALEKANVEKPSEPTKAKEKVSLVTDADRAEFGEELLDVQRRVATEVSQGYEDRLEKQDGIIKKLQDQLAQTGNQVGNLSFEQKLVQLVPDFAQLDKDERWVEWLNEYDPMLNGPRRVIAKGAYEQGDADTVAHYVNLWKQTIAQPEADPRAGRQAELEKQVAPNRSANSVDTKKVGKEAKIYSEREVNGAWTKIRNLNTKGSYDEAAKLEADITAAYLEGRVRQ